MDTCPNCGGTMIGDGHTSVVHCENVDDDDALMCAEPDASPILCTPVDEEKCDWFPKQRILHDGEPSPTPDTDAAWIEAWKGDGRRGKVRAARMRDFAAKMEISLRSLI